MKIMDRNAKKQLVSIRVFFAFFVTASLVILSSCGVSEETSVPIVVADSSTPCPTSVSRTNFQSTYSPMLIYVLIEGTESYKESVIRSFDILKDVLATKVAPRDKVLISFMEYFDTDLARQFNSEVLDVEIPNYAYSPLVRPTSPTSAPLPTKEGTFGQFVQTTAVQITETAYSSLLTKVADEHNCGQIEEEAHNKLLFNEWDKKRQEAVDQFLTNYSETIDSINLDKLPKTTNPVRALAQATEIFKLFRETGIYKQNYLVIFSNLGGTNSNPPATDNVDLKGVNVFVILQQCTFISDCSGTVSRWETYFHDAGALRVTFLPKSNEKDALILYLER